MRDKFILIVMTWGVFVVSCSYEKKEVRSQITEKYEDGTVKKITPISNGVPNGRVIEYDEKGLLLRAYHIKDGVPYGNDTVFSESGKPQIIRRYIDGKFHGEVKAYYETGELMLHEEYDNGQRLFQKVYFPEGNLKSTYINDIAKSYFFNGKLRRITNNRDPLNQKIIEFSGSGKLIELKGELDYLDKEDSILLIKSYPNWQEDVSKKGEN
ncbi:toxin-antitoxin system YwqK family antitoxin [Sporocytophaga myxococcoides]|uniref:toxin-antitoxin system YwqK family antitoxin n=1 Tax=Sporocytophaga myxococcoides TaxID=153721 RepID=UPI0004005775|nr:hypothetical protein [Sporocytophaga myxococcoides]